MAHLHKVLGVIWLFLLACIGTCACVRCLSAVLSLFMCMADKCCVLRVSLACMRNPEVPQRFSLSGHLRGSLDYSRGEQERASRWRTLFLMRFLTSSPLVPRERWNGGGGGREREGERKRMKGGYFLQIELLDAVYVCVCV